MDKLKHDRNFVKVYWKRVMLLEFIEFQSAGATRPFLAVDENGEKWIVKFHGNPVCIKTSFNEFVASSLANLLNLPWPQVKIGTLSKKTKKFLRCEELSLCSNDAIAIRYLSDLRNLDFDEDYSEISLKNPINLGVYFSNPERVSGFYGKMIFDNWVQLEDIKYDSLCIDSLGRPVFLDASFAFGGCEWDVSKLKWPRVVFDIRSPYLEGILTELDCMEYWIGQLNNIEIESYSRILDRIPGSWDVPKDYCEAILSFLSDTKSEYIPIINEWIEWKLSMKEHNNR